MAAKMDDKKASGFVFRVLSGSMNGIEFSLDSHTYFICTGDVTENQDTLAQSLGNAERTLYLPTTTASHNFIVNLTNVVDEEFAVSVNHPDHQENLTLKFNTVCQIGGVCFTLKHEGQAWSKEVLSGVIPAATHTDAMGTATRSTTKKPARNRGSWAIAAGLAIVLGVGGTVAWSKYNVAPVSDSTAHLLQQLDNRNVDGVDCLVEQGRDNIYYVLTPDMQHANWARRLVSRAGSTDFWKVQTRQEEEARLARVLERNHISFFTIRFTDLHTPTVIISSTRNTTDPAALDKFKKTLLEAMPYAKKVNIELKSDADVLRMAEEGLAALGFDYQMTQSDSGVTLSSPISAEDSRVVEFNRYVSGFYKAWGRHYVHFVAEFRDDSLKDKSFKYGQDGYVKAGKSHWVFNT
jgi:type III secretion system PrgH/EprH family protein